MQLHSSIKDVLEFIVNNNGTKIAFKNASLADLFRVVVDAIKFKALYITHDGVSINGVAVCRPHYEIKRLHIVGILTTQRVAFPLLMKNILNDFPQKLGWTLTGMRGKKGKIIEYTRLNRGKRLLKIS